MTHSRVTGVILAGGAGRRMGGQDKGLIPFRGRPMVAWVIDALVPQVDEILIVANRNLEAYARFSHRVVRDQRPDFPGPLAGFEAALSHATHPTILTCPTDAPLLPTTYASRMGRAAPAVASWGGFWQPVFCHLPVSALESLHQALDSGERKAMRWLATLNPQIVKLDELALQLRDADSPGDLAALDDDPH